jgi:AraC-like DNA-binding protein
MKRNVPAVFEVGGHVYTADTCEPVRAAAARGDVRLSALVHGTYPGRLLPPDTLPEICSVGVWDAPGDQTWGLATHRNEGIELTYLSRGKAAFAVQRRSYALRRGHLTITRPWQAHSVGNPGVTASRLHWLILDVGMRRPNQPWRWPSWVVLSPPDLRRLTTLLRHNEQPVWHVGGEVGRCFERLTGAVEQGPGPSAETRLKIEINALLAAIMDILGRRRVPLDGRLSSNQRTVELFLSELRKNLEGEWTLEAMAEQCGLGRSRFAHYCRLVTNLPPMVYLAQCRVKESARMLGARSDLSVTDVAMACGFPTSQYFATLFRKQMGVTPSEYRRKRGITVVRRPRPPREEEPLLE